MPHPPLRRSVASRQRIKSRDVVFGGVHFWMHPVLIDSYTADTSCNDMQPSETHLESNLTFQLLSNLISVSFLPEASSPPLHAPLLY